MSAPSSFDSCKDRYSELVNESIAFSGLTVDFFARAKARHLIELATRSLRDLRRVQALDVGCGRGVIHPCLAGAFQSLTGVDVAPQTIELARQANRWVQYQTFDGGHLPFANASFQLVFSINVLHHVQLPRRQAFVTELRRVTAPGGLVVIFEHNPYNLLTRYAVSRCPFDCDAVLLAARQGKRLLREAGLARVRCRYITFTPFEGRVASLIDRALGRVALGAQYFVAGDAS